MLERLRANLAAAIAPRTGQAESQKRAPAPFVVQPVAPPRLTDEVYPAPTPATRRVSSAEVITNLSDSLRTAMEINADQIRRAREAEALVKNAVPQITALNNANQAKKQQIAQLTARITELEAENTRLKTEAATPGTGSAEFDDAISDLVEAVKTLPAVNAGE